jgi:hypothetical protein
VQQLTPTRGRFDAIKNSLELYHLEIIAGARRRSSASPRWRFERGDADAARMEANGEILPSTPHRVAFVVISVETYGRLGNCSGNDLCGPPQSIASNVGRFRAQRAYR